MPVATSGPLTALISFPMNSAAMPKNSSVPGGVSFDNELLTASQGVPAASLPAVLVGAGPPTPGAALLVPALAGDGAVAVPVSTPTLTSAVLPADPGGGGPAAPRTVVRGAGGVTMRLPAGAVAPTPADRRGDADVAASSRADARPAAPTPVAAMARAVVSPLADPAVISSAAAGAPITTAPVPAAATPPSVRPLGGPAVAVRPVRDAARARPPAPATSDPMPLTAPVAAVANPMVPVPPGLGGVTTVPAIPHTEDAAAPVHAANPSVDLRPQDLADAGRTAMPQPPAPGPGAPAMATPFAAAAPPGPEVVRVQTVVAEAQPVTPPGDAAPAAPRDVSVQGADVLPVFRDAAVSPSAARGAGHGAPGDASAGSDPATSGPAPDPAVSTVATMPPAMPAPFAAALPVTSAATPAVSGGAPIPLASPAHQVAPALLALGSSADGAQHLTLRLQPESLGVVEVRIARSAGGTAHISVTADNEATLQLLTNEQADLHRALDQAGIPVAGRTLSLALSGVATADKAAGGADASGWTPLRALNPGRDAADGQEVGRGGGQTGGASSGAGAGAPGGGTMAGGGTAGGEGAPRQQQPFIFPTDFRLPDAADATA